MQFTASNVRLVAVVLTALCTVSGGIYLVFCKRKDYRRAFAYKGTAGLCFVALALSGVTAREDIKRFPYRPRIVLNGVGDIPGEVSGKN